MLQHPVLYGLGALLLIVLFFFLKSRWRTHWKPWIGFGWVINYDEKTERVTIGTFLLKSPAAEAGVVRGSIMLERNGEKLPSFENKEAFLQWVHSFKPARSKAVTFKLLEPGKNGWVERDVTLTYKRIHGEIPYFPRRFFTSEERHQHWKQSVGRANNYYPQWRCPRTGVTYETRRVVPIDI